MKVTMRPIRASLLTALVLLAGFLPRARAGDSAQSWRTFESSFGGVRLETPVAWHVKEIEGDGSYQAFLSREKVEKEGDLYTYGVSVLRLKNYRKQFSFTSMTVDEILLEYANRVAANLAEGGTAVVIGLPKEEDGWRLARFRLMAGSGKNCLSLSLLVGLRGNQWFHALWELPCSETKAEGRDAEISHMIESLQVEKKWGPQKK